jgi:pyridoxal phosphate enzyme (YggS family)
VVQASSLHILEKSSQDGCTTILRFVVQASSLHILEKSSQDGCTTILLRVREAEPPVNMRSVAQNLERIRQRIADAALRAGRDADDVRLVAVTKYHDLDEMRALLDAGHRVLGESRIQEVLPKIEALGTIAFAPPIEWHLIGHLQTNKANKAVGPFALIHGVDSLHLAEALQRAAESADTTVSILLQANVSGEESKHGVAPEGLEPLVRALRPLDRVRCLGLMTMAPYECAPEATRPVFRALREWRDRLRELGLDHLDLRHLSMGMTNDFEVAVEEGATWVRVGTAIFE